MRILVVEDEPILREGLTDLLSGAGHRVTAVADGASAAERGTAEEFDIILLDLMLPKLDGIEVCRRIRKARPAVPILMLTARGAEEDKVKGLKVGADDYVTKPFGAKELLARIDAVSRRARAAPTEPETFEADGCAFDLGRFQARRGKERIPLTELEVGLLRWLRRHGSRAVPREELLAHVWGITGRIETRTVDMAVANLRKKIERDPSEPRLVVSVKGIGYAWGEAAR